MNRKKKYKIVDSKGKTIETVRTKQAASIEKPKIRRNRFYEEVEIVRIDKPKGLNIHNLKL